MLDKNSESAAYLAVSPWVGSPTNLRPPLDADTRADVAIVGGGLTGLSTALELRRKGLDVALVEANFAGFGASGRNAGHLTPTIGKDLPTLLMLFGKDKSVQLIGFAEHGVERVEQLIAQLGIECDYRPSGNIMAAVHPKQEKRLRAAVDAAASIGAHVRFLDRNEMLARGIPVAPQNLIHAPGGHANGPFGRAFRSGGNSGRLSPGRDVSEPRYSSKRKSSGSGAGAPRRTPISGPSIRAGSIR